MSLTRFADYAGAFEQAYAADDWAVLTPYFTEDAVYEVRLDGIEAAVYRGRPAVLEYLARITRVFDKRFASRRLVPFEPPSEKDGAVWLHGAALYTMPDGACCHLVMTEQVEFRGEGIVRLTDDIAPAGVAEVAAFQRRYPEVFDEPILAAP